MSPDPMDATERTIAWFASHEGVRAVEIDLEQHGIDPLYVSVPTADPREARTIDRETAGWAGRRAVIGGVVGALLGIAIGAVLGLLLADSGVAAVAFAVGGAAFGIPVGVFYMVAVRLPASPEAFDTFAGDTPGDNWIAVSGPPDVRRSAAEIMATHDPQRFIRS